MHTSLQNSAQLTHHLELTHAACWIAQTGSSQRVYTLSQYHVERYGLLCRDQGPEKVSECEHPLWAMLSVTLTKYIWLWRLIPSAD